MLEPNAVDVVDHILKVAAMDTSESAIPQELFVSSMTLASIAISLKRIADALNYVPAGEQNIYDMMNDIRHNTAPRSR